MGNMNFWTFKFSDKRMRYSLLSLAGGACLRVCVCARAVLGRVCLHVCVCARAVLYIDSVGEPAVPGKYQALSGY